MAVHQKPITFGYEDKAFYRNGTNGISRFAHVVYKLSSGLGQTQRYKL